MNPVEATPSEILTPTLKLRWFWLDTGPDIDTVDWRSIYKKQLEQLFLTDSGEERWVPVPVVKSEPYSFASRP